MSRSFNFTLRGFILVFAAMLTYAIAAASEPASSGPEIRTSDVDRFYVLYDAKGGRPTAEQLQAYIDGGTEGFRAFTAMRKTTGERIAQAIAKQPEIYVKAKQCAAALPAVKIRLAKALAQLKNIYPDASFPPITIGVGRGRPTGTADRNGVMIGLESLCFADFLNPDVEDRFVYVIAHEYVHVQQAQFSAEDPEEKVLKATLIEGGAEFIGELTSGSVSYKHLQAAVKGHEREFETAFLGDLDKKAIGSAWLYNYPGTPEHPADMGYWIGYRIAKAYYGQAKDKRQALRDVIELRDPTGLLEKSGWYPGMSFE